MSRSEAGRLSRRLSSIQRRQAAGLLAGAIGRRRYAPAPHRLRSPAPGSSRSAGAAIDCSIRRKCPVDVIERSARSAPIASGCQAFDRPQEHSHLQRFGVGPTVARSSSLDYVLRDPGVGIEFAFRCPNVSEHRLEHGNPVQAVVQILDLRLVLIVAGAAKRFEMSLKRGNSSF